MMTEKNKNKDLTDDQQITMNDFMKIFGDLKTIIGKNTEMSGYIYEIMKSMDEDIGNLAEELSALRMDVEELGGNISTVDFTVSPLMSEVETISSNIDRIDDKINSLDIDLHAIKLDTEYLEKDHENIENNLMNIAMACDVKYEIDISSDSENSLLGDGDLSSEYNTVDNEWDNHEKDNRCVMCAGTGFIEEVTECDELQGEAEGSLDNQITCPYCAGSGIEDQ